MKNPLIMLTALVAALIVGTLAQGAESKVKLLFTGRRGGLLTAAISP